MLVAFNIMVNKEERLKRHSVHSWSNTHHPLPPVSLFQPVHPSRKPELHMQPPTFYIVTIQLNSVIKYRIYYIIYYQDITIHILGTFCDLQIHISSLLIL